MDLDFTEEQQLLRDTVRRVCAEHASLAVVRALEDDPVGYPKPLWDQMRNLGLVGLTLPERFGGGGQSALEAAIVYEELGRALAPSPHFVSAVMSGGVLARAGSDAQQAAWLPRIASGDAILTPAWLEPRGGGGPEGVQVRAVRDGAHYRLSGTKRHVAFARAAERLVVLARTGERPEDVDLLLVDPQASGVTLQQQFSLASDTQYQVELRDVQVPVADRIGAERGGWGVWDETMQDGIILLAAQAVGGAERALEMTVQYAKDREQFDKPLGAFQAIAHYLAGASAAVDGANTLVYEAAWARAQGKAIRRLAPMAKLFACQTFREVTAMAQQVHGGFGFTIESDIQLYFRRAKQLQLSWWDTRYLEELVAKAVLDGPEGLRSGIAAVRF
ncbi:MAG: acyl-CoA dehydrogenase family protein [Candidatus Binatia bacterium]